MTTGSPLARGPLLEWHRRAGAIIEQRGGWEIAVRYPAGTAAARPDVDAAGKAHPASALAATSNLLIDRSHLATFEVNGVVTGAMLAALCGVDLPLRQIHSTAGRDVYRLTPTRAIVFSASPRFETPLAPSGGEGGQVEMLDVTGGWATLSLIGPGAETILNKVTAVDLRERTLPVQGCCQGPVFGVNTLFGRFADRFDLHVCTDSAEFFWEVLLDAGAEFGLRPAGLEAFP